jgi:hypothetical protein
MILIFLVLALLSSLPAAAFVTGNNVNLAFAAGGGDSSGSGSSDSSSSSNNGGSESSSSSDNSGGGQGTAGGSESSNGGGGGSGSSNMAPQSPSPSINQQTCSDDLILNADGKCVPKNQSTTPMQTGNTVNNTTVNNTTTTQKKTGGGTTTTAAGTGNTTSTTTQMQAGNTGSNMGTTSSSMQAKCKGLSNFDPTTGSCTSGNPSTTQTNTATGGVKTNTATGGVKTNTATGGVKTNTATGGVKTNTATGGVKTNTTGNPTTSITLPYNPNVGCPSGYHVHTSIDTKIDECSKNGNNPIDMIVKSPPHTSPGTCPAGFKQVRSGGTMFYCSKHVQSLDGLCPVGTTAEPNQRGLCLVNNSPPGKTPSTQTGNGVGSGTTANTGTGGTTSARMTTPTKTGGGTTTTGAGTTTITTPNIPATTKSKTSPTSPQSSTAATSVITNNSNVLKSPSGAVATPSQTANNNLLAYVNTPAKISIRYPSTWTKTEFVGNPNIPVIFNAPTNDSSAKTTFMVNINELTPSSATPDGYTEQQIKALTNSSVIKYSITDTNSKVLTPPAGTTAYREISYNGIKNNIVNNTSTQIPLKGTAIFFVNGGKGYSLLYLAKQTEYNQNLPIVQQMINTFQTNATSSGAGSGPTGGSLPVG